MEPNGKTKSDNENGICQNEEKTTDVNETKVLRWLTTILLYASFMGLGMIEGLLPATFLDLRDQLGVDISTMSFAFTTRYAGVVLGGVSAGWLTNIKTINKSLLLGVCLIVSSVLMIITPWLQHVALVMMMIGLYGILNGLADTVHNVLLILTWGQQAGPYLQGLHLSYSAGTFITPVLAIPFLSRQIHSAHNNSKEVIVGDQSEMFIKKEYILLNNHTFTMNESYYSTNTSNGLTNITTMTRSSIQFVYMILGLYVGIMGLCFCILVRCKKKNGSMPATEVYDQEESVINQTHDTLPRYYRIKFLIFLGLIFFAYGSIQSTIGGLLIPFVVQGLHWTKQQGTMIISAYWIIASISRLINIPIYATKVITVTKLIVINILMTFLSSIIFVIFVQFHFIVVWITMLGISIGQATLFVAAMLWYQENIMPVTTGIIPSILVSSQCLGAILVPLLTGYLIDKVQAMCFSYVIVTLTTLMTSLSCFTYVSVRLYKKRHKQTEIATEVEMKPMM
ncbi:unnamed protein product [Owenia fusiformis]|uniref:Uncharacterized protein n=1 Tax=Owenia fusiformis TaxID=6347 RepID=A0A8J1U0W3_OWEFU|nr:unnamed protein product [Owenia fusiformis]